MTGFEYEHISWFVVDVFMIDGADGPSPGFRIQKRPAFRPILISGENGFHRPCLEERLRPVTTGVMGQVRFSKKGRLL
jgi:hypothetical protein